MASKNNNRRNKGSGSIFRKPSGSYCFQYRDIVTGKLKTKVLLDENGDPIHEKKMAEKHAESEIKEYQKLVNADSWQKHAIQIAEYRGIISGIKIPLDSVWTKFTDSPIRSDCSKQTLKGYSTVFKMFNNWVKIQYPQIKLLNELDEKIIIRYFSNLWDSGISERTYNAHLQALRLVFKIISKEHDLKLNLLDNISKKQENKQTRKEFTKKDIIEIFKAFEDPSLKMQHKQEMRTMFNICCMTGMRGQDACILKWDDINFQQNTISYIPEKIKRKSQNKKVIVSIHPALKEELLHACDWKQKDSTYVLPNVAIKYFRNNSGISKDITRLLKHAGFETSQDTSGLRRKKKVCKFSMHSCRHTFVSFCANAGVPMAIVQSIVGHGSPAMTQHYTHISQEATEKAVNSLPTITAIPSPKATPQDLIKQLLKYASKADMNNILRILSRSVIST